MTRSTLELLLESIVERDEAPPDLLPSLPQRPTSRARLPSRRGRPALLFADPNCDQSNGYVRHQSMATNATPESFLHQSNVEKQESHRGTPLLREGFAASGTLGTGRSLWATEVSGVGQNGRGKEMGNGNGSAQNAEAGQANGHEETIKRGAEANGNSVEQDMLSAKKQKQGDDLTSLKKRKRDHRIQSPRKESRVWVLNQENKWMLGVVQSASDTDSIVRMVDGQILRTLPEKLFPANPEVLDGVDDLVQLSFIHEPAILHNLQRRYGLGKIYTRAGSILIALTPSKEHQSRNHNSLEALKTRAKGCKHPHAHMIADSAFEAMMREGMNQSVIISGESGAGKTQSAKSTLQYLVFCGGNTELGNLLLQTDPILEAFGNAKMPNNANASRFGKTTDVYYDSSGKLCGAKCQTVFFEKSRVVCRAEGEQSYHIFYQLCEGAGPSLREKLNLRDAKEFEYLNKSGCNGVDGSDYHTQFQSVLNALCILGVTEKDQETIFTLLAAILWLGNIQFSALGKEIQAVDNAAKLLKCSREDLLGALGTGEGVAVNMVAARDALAQSIYERLFEWLVVQINKALEVENAGDFKCITIVDVPGFGFSKRNGLEGMLVNYSHEYLQHYIQRHLFQQHEEDIICGGSNSFRIDYSRNEESIDFLEKGLFPLIHDDESSALSKESDLRFSQRFEALLADSACCKQMKSLEFAISHSFGEMTYDATSFLEGIKVTLSPQLLQILHSCMARLPELSAIKNKDPFQKSWSADLPQETFFFRCQKRVLQMMQWLDNTAPHFILCIRPNELLLASSLEQDLILRQLCSNRVPEVVRASRSGYPTTISHQLFASRFGVLLARSVAKGQDALGICVAVLQQFDVPPDMYQVGLTKLFFRSGEIDKLESTREKFLERIVGVQKTYRGYKLRYHLEKQTKAVTHLQALVRGWLIRKGFLHQGAENIAIERVSDMHNKSESKPISEDDTLNMDLSRTSVSDGEQEDDAFMLRAPLIKTGEEKHSVQVYDFSKQTDGKGREKPALEEMQMQKLAAETALQRKEDENAILQESMKEYERKWTAYEAKMKSMEEMWQKQIASLQQCLSAATKGVNSEEPSSQAIKHNDQCTVPDQCAVQNTRPQGTMAGNTPEIPLHAPDLAVDRSEIDPSRSILDHLTKELERRTQVFNDDADFLVEVKSGQIEMNFKPVEELQKLKQRFDVWKKDFKFRLKETKSILKKFGKSESPDKSKKKWWGRKSS